MTTNFIEQLAAAAIQAPSADNNLPYTLHWDGAALSIRYAHRHPEYNVFQAGSHATLLAIGAVMEYVDVALRAQGLPASWQWQGAAGLPYASVAIAHQPAGFARPETLYARHTNRLPFRRTALPAAVAASAAARTEAGNRVIVLEDRARKAALVKLVRICSEARFCDEALHKWLFGSLRYTPRQVEQGDGLDLRTLGLPPGGRQMLALISDWKRLSVLNRLGAYKLLAVSEVGLISAAPALLCVVGRRGERDVADAGRLLARSWCELNREGLAVQPYYVVTDQINRLRDGVLAAGFAARIGAAERELRGLLGLAADEALHMILRVGYPKGEPVRSRRLPLAAVLEDVTTS